MQKSDYHSETIANVALEILGSYGADYTRESINEYITRFNSDLFNDPLEQAELTDEIEQFLTDHGQDFLDEYDEQHALDQILEVRDNGGESFDRFTIVLKEKEQCANDVLNTMLGMSINPTDPLGFSQCSNGHPGDHLGKLIDFFELPENVQKHVIDRLR